MCFICCFIALYLSFLNKKKITCLFFIFYFFDVTRRGRSALTIFFLPNNCHSVHSEIVFHWCINTTVKSPLTAHWLIYGLNWFEQNHPFCPDRKLQWAGKGIKITPNLLNLFNLVPFHKETLNYTQGTQGKIKQTPVILALLRHLNKDLLSGAQCMLISPHIAAICQTPPVYPHPPDPK